MIKSTWMKWAGHVACIGEKRNAYKLLVGQPEGKRPIGRLRHRLKDDIKVDIMELGFGMWVGFRIGTSGGLL
jgi:hypothetical protein